MYVLQSKCSAVRVGFTCEAPVLPIIQCRIHREVLGIIPVRMARSDTAGRRRRNLPGDTVIFKGQRCSLQDSLKDWVATGRDLFTNAKLSTEKIESDLLRM